MPPLQSPEQNVESAVKSMSAAAAAWQSVFVEHLGRHFADDARQQSENEELVDHRRIMSSAFVQALADSGARPAEIVALLQENIDRISHEKFAHYLSPAFTSRLEEHMRHVRTEIAKDQALGK